MNNREYFEYSQQHIEEGLDFSNPSGCLVISRSAEDAPTSLMQRNQTLLDLITTYKTLQEDPSSTTEQLDRVVDRIIAIIETANGINYSPFCTYFQVLGYSFSTYCSEKNSLSVDRKRSLFKNLIEYYIQHRHNTYTFHGYSDIVLQSNSDSASSRRKGKIGIQQTIDFLQPLGFLHATSLESLRQTPFAYILPDKGQTIIFNQFLTENNIVFNFRNTRDAKNPDMLLKIGTKVIIMEHKLTNGSGGSQNAEINEIIQFISFSEENENVHYVSCLAGNYFRRLTADNREPKIRSQYNNIMTSLNHCPRNYFVNGIGLQKLVRDFISE